METPVTPKVVCDPCGRDIPEGEFLACKDCFEKAQAVPGRAEVVNVKPVLFRIGRALLALLAAGAAAKYQDNQYYMLALPALMGGAKALRDKYPGRFEWLPF